MPSGPQLFNSDMRSWKTEMKVFTDSNLHLTCSKREHRYTAKQTDKWTDEKAEKRKSKSWEKKDW